MTKLKSKKMSKSTFAVIIMAILMVAMLAFGGTYAYFTATTTAKSDTATTGKVLLANSAVTLTESKVVPTMEVLADGSKIAVTNSSDVEVYIFVTFSVKFDGTAASASVLTVDLADSAFTALTGHDGVYFVKTSTTGELALTDSIIFNAEEESTDGSETGLQYMGKTIEVSISSEAIQAYGFDSETAAYTELTSAA